jgi:hypothetical protein
MAYYTDSESGFNEEYFSGELVIERLAWPHWPASIPLFAGDFKGTIRSIVMGLNGRSSTEGPMIPMQRTELERKEEGQGPRSVVLSSKETGAVAGLATYGRHPIWSGSVTVDVYCHPSCWDRAGELIDAIEMPSADRCLAYCDVGFEEKERVLKKAGFAPVASFEKRVAADRAKSRYVDVVEWEKIP